ncbi:MAG TPA: hypothetical protein ENK55_05500, partial [Actinobacteria bacterium]|nr:hypothetical protein [Actinomycetota bacterium]
DYLDGNLEPELARRLEAHLEHCPTCPPLYAALVDARSGLEGLRDPDAVVPPDLERRIRAAIDHS